MNKHRCIITLISLVIVSLAPTPGVLAQSYLVTYNSFSVTLYKGCVQLMDVPVISGKDFRYPIEYIFHAQSTGAEIDYDSLGRITILPYRDGNIKVFLMKGNTFYRVKGSISFRVVNPPAPNMDAVFDQNMGNPPKTKLQRQKQFSLPANSKVEDSEFEVNGYWLNHLSNNTPTEIRVDVLLKENDKYIPQVGEVSIQSSDATIEKKEGHKFLITPLPSKKRCTLSVSFNGKKIDEKTFSIF